MTRYRLSLETSRKRGPVVLIAVVLAIVPEVISSYYSDEDPERAIVRDEDIVLLSFTPGFTTFLGDLMKDLDYNAQERRGNTRPSVELGPGALKSPILKYPEKYFESKLKHLIKLQQKQDERNKAL